MNTGTPLPADGNIVVQATALDASGNVFVTGSFTGTVRLGSTLLTAVYGAVGANGTLTNDLFVAKYVPATRTWAWALSGGGTGVDQGNGIAVSGNGVYITGSITNTLSNLNGVLFSTTSGAAPSLVQNGTSSSSSTDLIVAKYTDNGSSATLSWLQVGGGSERDEGAGIAVSGSSVYVTGYIANNSADYHRVRFGGSGTTAGTVPVLGACAATPARTWYLTELLVAKYTDNGTSASLAWTQVGGGDEDDMGQAIAVSGSSVYVTGFIRNDLANNQRVLFGASGTTPATVPQYGASTTRNSPDLVVAKYVDNGGSASLGWTQVGGGTSADGGYSLAVSGSSVYVTGALTNNVADGNRVRFGGAGTTAGTVAQAGAAAAAGSDLVLAKYTDNGTSASLAWTQVGGGSGDERGSSIGLSGSQIYVSSRFYNDAADSYSVRFGGTGLTPGTVAVPGIRAATSAWITDVVVARYTDAGSSSAPAPDWTKVGNGLNSFYSPQTYLRFDPSLAVRGSNLAVSGYLEYRGSAFTPGAPSANNYTQALVALLADGGSSGAWQELAPVYTGGRSVITAAATDAAGNVFVTGYFTGEVAFGSVVLATYATNWRDLFVAKYVPATGTWAWAQRGGGAQSDAGTGIAVSGANVYVTGYLTNDSLDAAQVTFGADGPGTARQLGVSRPRSQDWLVAKYVDQGTSASLAWTQVAGGTGDDSGQGIAVSGTSVYVTGSLRNTLTNGQRVRFGGTGTAPGTQAQYGASATTSDDVVLAKYIDQGTSASVAWTQVGGGSGTDGGYGVAVSGASVYVAGSITNTFGDANGVRFGGAGTTAGTVAQNGAAPSATSSNQDLVVAKYTDNGATAALGWTQVAGGAGTDFARGVAASGSSVYVTGAIFGGGVLFGGSGSTLGMQVQNGASATASFDLVLAKYVDQGASASVAWTQVGGGTGFDQGQALAASGGSVYVTGAITNSNADASAVRFGGGGSTPGTVPVVGSSAGNFSNAVVASYADNGTSASLNWAQAGGAGLAPNTNFANTGTNNTGLAVALSGGGLYVGGTFNPTASTFFGSLALPNPPNSAQLFLATLAPPLLSALSAATAPVGSQLTITGTNLAGAVSVSFNGAVQTNFISVSPTQLVLLVPAGATSGPLTVTTSAGRTNALAFAVGPLAVAPGQAGAAVQLYPNPARAGGATLVGAPAGAAVQVLDALGRQVLATRADAQGTAVLRLPAGTRAGVYVVRAGPQAFHLLVE